MWRRIFSAIRNDPILFSAVILLGLMAPMMFSDMDPAARKASSVLNGPAPVTIPAFDKPRSTSTSNPSSDDAIVITLPTENTAQKTVRALLAGTLVIVIYAEGNERRIEPPQLAEGQDARNIETLEKLQAFTTLLCSRPLEDMPFETDLSPEQIETICSNSAVTTRQTQN